MALCTATQVKTHLVTSTTKFDTLLAQLIPQVDLIVEKETGVKTQATGTTDVNNEVRDHDGSLMLKTKFKPVASVDTIEYRSSMADSWATYTGSSEVDAELNRIHTEEVVIGKGRRNLRLSYQCGYATASVPVDLNLCAILMVVGLFNHRQQVGLKTQSVLGVDMELDQEDHAFVKRVLMKYKEAIVL